MERALRRIGWSRIAVTAACLAAWLGMEQIAVVQPNNLLTIVRYGIPSYSIVALGVYPYVIALIVFAILPVISRTIRSMSESPDGRARLKRWTNAAAALLALGQAYGYTVILEADSEVPPLDWFSRLALMLALTAGTMILVLLAGVMDERGLGFGHGVLIFYVLGYVRIESSRLADFVRYASAYSDRSAYGPLVAWTAISIAMIAAAAVLLHSRRLVRLPDGRHSSGLALPLLMSGVLRPPLYANAVLFLPQVAANYYASVRPQVAMWLAENWSSYGPNAWTDAAYTVLYAGLIAAAVYFIVYCEFEPKKLAEAIGDSDATTYIHAIGRRLTLACALFLALMIAVVPAVAAPFTHDRNHNGLSVSGAYALLITALVLAVAAAVGRRRKGLAFTPRLV